MKETIANPDFIKSSNASDLLGIMTIPMPTQVNSAERNQEAVVGVMDSETV